MRTLIFALILIAAAAIAYFYFLKDSGDEEPVVETPVVTEEPETAPDDADEALETLALPRFDIVRVDRTGNVQFAGQAEPNSKVELLANGEPVISEQADSRGEFAAFTDEPLPPGSVEFGLRMTTPDGMTVTSPDTIIIFIPEGAGEAIVLRTTPGGATQVLQGADSVAPGLGPLRIEAIDYDEAGNAIFSGSAEPSAVVQIFANNSPVGETSSDENGRWSLSTTIPQGRYTLLIVQLGEDGEPKFAIEVPFEQASREDIVMSDGNVIVQPGNSLWVISRSVYGEGQQYTVIYAANADQIRDPDLIYPGQVFRVPEEGEEDEEDDQ